MTTAIMKGHTRQEINAVPKVDFTDTWSPWHHSEIIDIMENSLDGKGIKVMSEKHELSQDGKDLFSTLLLDLNGMDSNLPASAKSALSLGMRNSMKKRFGLGLVGGESVYVCSNLGFWGDFKEVRRHDSRLDSLGLQIFIDDAIDTVIDERGRYIAWFEQMADAPIDKTDVKILTYEAMERDILPPSQFHKFTGALLEEVSEQQQYGSKLTGAHFHGGMTRTMRAMNMARVMERSRKLNGLLENHLGIPMVKRGRSTTPTTLSDLMI